MLIYVKMVKPIIVNLKNMLNYFLKKSYNKNDFVILKICIEFYKRNSYIPTKFYTEIPLHI